MVLVMMFAGLAILSAVVASACNSPNTQEWEEAISRSDDLSIRFGELESKLRIRLSVMAMTQEQCAEPYYKTGKVIHEVSIDRRVLDKMQSVWNQWAIVGGRREFLIAVTEGLGE